jgi:nucleoside-diphosphate-sugar epimerase
VNILIIGSSGYIGSALAAHLIRDHYLAYCDVVNGPKGDYRTLTPGHFECVDVVIHLAGHSSVASCEADPWGATDNNLTSFIPFLRMLSELPEPPLLLWASSGSVLSDVHSLYDQQKRALEALVPRLYPRSIGMRFASVCGVSEIQRDDIILNAMVKSAVTTGVVNMANPLVYKPILGLKNLCACVEYLILRQAEYDHLGGTDRSYQYDTVDLCSFTTNPEQAAQAVAAFTGAKINRLPPSQAYEFRMSEWRRVDETLESVIAELVEHYQGQQ